MEWSAEIGEWRWWCTRILTFLYLALEVLLCRVCCCFARDRTDDNNDDNDYMRHTRVICDCVCVCVRERFSLQCCGWRSVIVCMCCNLCVFSHNCQLRKFAMCSGADLSVLREIQIVVSPSGKERALVPITF